MKRIDKLSLLIKDRGIKFIVWYITIILFIQLMGSLHDAFNHKTVKQYKEIVEDFGDFLKENNIEDPTQVFDYFNYALWGGYLSKDHNFQYNLERDIFFSNYGLGCVLGDSVCLNNAGMLSDLYESMGMDSEVLICYVPVGKVRIDEIRGQENIVRKIVENENDEDVDDNDSLVISIPILFDPLSFVIGNHAITLVHYNGEDYYYDPTNLAYLSKSSINDLDIINGEGSFKTRRITTLLFEIDSSIKALFDKNEDDYNLEYLNTLETVDIDVLELEKFYLQESYLIDSVYDSLKSKSHDFLKVLIIVLSGVLYELGTNVCEKIIYKKNITNECKLKYLISLFLKENGIEKFEDVCCYLYELINRGELSCDEDNLRIKKSVLFETSALVTVDNHEYGRKFFAEYLKSKFGKVKTIEGVEEETSIVKEFFVYRAKDGYKFYDYDGGLIYNIDDACELVSPDNKYKIQKVFKKKYKNSTPVNQPSIDFDICFKFGEEVKPIVDKIAKSYAYVPKK